MIKFVSRKKGLLFMGLFTVKGHFVFTAYHHRRRHIESSGNFFPFKLWTKCHNDIRHGHCDFVIMMLQAHFTAPLHFYNWNTAYWCKLGPLEFLSMQSLEDMNTIMEVILQSFGTATSVHRAQNQRNEHLKKCRYLSKYQYCCAQCTAADFLVLPNPNS